MPRHGSPRRTAAPVPPWTEEVGPLPYFLAEVVVAVLVLLGLCTILACVAAGRADRQRGRLRAQLTSGSTESQCHLELVESEEEALTSAS
jgi:hypothetical protein